MVFWSITGSWVSYFKDDILLTYLVTLKVRRSLTQRRTERPRGGMTEWKVRIISSKLLNTTKKSNRLNKDTK